MRSLRILLVISATLPIASSPSPFSVFLIETVDSEGNVGVWNSLALDTNGNPHIGYYKSGGSIKYASKVENSWITEFVDPLGPQAFPSLALDNMDQPHIAYNRRFRIKLASKVAGSWLVEDVPVRRERPSLVIDTHGDIHIAAGFPRSIRYGVKRAGNWVVSLVDTAEPQGVQSPNVEGPALAIGPDGTAHLVYLYDEDFFSGQAIIRYATQSNGAWVHTDLARTEMASPKYSIAVDADGTPHVAFYADLQEVVKYAVPVGRFWRFETIDSASAKSQSLALDAEGNPHVSYSYPGTGELRYAHKSDGSWIIATVDPDAAAQGYTSIALETNGRPHVTYHSYSDLSRRNLEYAYSRRFTIGEEDAHPIPLGQGDRRAGLEAGAALSRSRPTPLAEALCVFSPESRAASPPI